MYCSIVSAIVSASSSEFSWSENKLKSGNLNLSRLNVLKCLLDDRNSSGRYTVSNGSGYAVLVESIRCIGQKVGYAVSDGSGYT
ncbi:hypothetical protein Tco_0069399 [Tanacetum coccineum]